MSWDAMEEYKQEQEAKKTKEWAELRRQTEEQEKAKAEMQDALNAAAKRVLERTPDYDAQELAAEVEAAKAKAEADTIALQARQGRRAPAMEDDEATAADYRALARSMFGRNDD